VTAWELVAQGSWYFHHVTQPMHLKAGELFRQASRIDPELTQARLWVGRVNAGLVAYGDDFALALRSAEKAVGLSPSFALDHLVLGMAALYSGDTGRAAQSLEHGLRLNRYDPQNFVWYNVLALACLFDARPEDALRHAMTSLQVRPSWRSAMRTAAAAHAALRHRDAAGQWLRLWSQMPAAADALQPLWRCNPRWAGEMARLLEDG
jgi:tetratricopeptide (TPR) repeat protein